MTKDDVFDSFAAWFVAAMLTGAYAFMGFAWETDLPNWSYFAVLTIVDAIVFATLKIERKLDALLERE